jgi:flagellar motor component MotA
MKGNTLLIVGGAALLLLLLSNTGAAAATTGVLNISSLIGYNTYATQDAINRLNSIYQELQSRGLTTMQILFALSQVLFESGLFTDVANYTRMNLNNYAGLTVVGGGYASYNSISDFVDAYLGFLTKGSNPLGASSITDFNNRLQQNGYYTENPAVYLNALNAYYNLLSQTIGQ